MAQHPTPAKKTKVGPSKVLNLSFKIYLYKDMDQDTIDRMIRDMRSAADNYHSVQQASGTLLK